MVARLQHILQLWRYFGPTWLGYRAGYAFRQRMGLLQRGAPAIPWDEQPLAGFLADPSLATPDAYLSYRRTHAPPFFFAPEQRSLYRSRLLRYDSADNTPLQIVRRLAAGQMAFFAHNVWEVGALPQWHRNALTGQTAPVNRHWSQIPDFEFGDIKAIWEPSRFGFAYALVRSYWRTGDERHAESFWQLVEDWREHNPPQLGPNWKCGQEIAFRIMAWVFGLYGFLAAPATTSERATALAQMIAVSAHRIEANLNYALSQRNNHGISEGMGLWLVGLLFPEFRRAEFWREKGRQVLERLGRELIYDDGSFVQHSVNYHRLMLHDYLWAVRLGDLNEQPLSDTLRERVAKATEFLYQIQDTETGQVPYYGQNDGALILPLNNCDYQDFRPVVQAGYYLATGKRCYASGPWDEDLLWLFGPEALQAEVAPLARSDFRADAGGYYTLRSQNGFVFVRCATHTDRPGQADMLHVDLWWQGLNIALDAGTYSYNAPAPWDNPLAHTRYHNTVTVDDVDQMDRVGRFLWLPWLRSQVSFMHRSAFGTLAYWEGAHDGYRRLPDPVIHRRGMLHVADDAWLVLDYLQGQDEHDFRLHWLFPDWPYEWRHDAGEFTLQTPRGAYHVHVTTTLASRQWSLVRAEESTPKGWRAPYYSYREPALSLVLGVHAHTTLFATFFSPTPGRVELGTQEIQLITADWQVTAQLLPEDQGVLLGSIRLTGNRHDILETR